jgi:tetratricopeptide (TPR) repeat protein
MSFALRVRQYLAARAFNRGTMLTAADDLPGAQSSLLTSLALAPYTAMTWLNLGNAMMQEGDPDAALGCYRRAMNLEPGHPRGAVNAAIALLTLGQWDEGWKLYEQRFALPQFQIRNGLKGGDESKMWRGEPLDGKTLLVFNEQGIGDVLMMARYLGSLSLDGSIVVRAPASLLRLMRSSFGWLGVNCVSDAERMPAHDYLVPFMSLPFHLRPLIDEAPRSVYMSLYEDEPRYVVGLPEFTKVGIVWAGNPNHTGDKVRSIPFDTFAPLLNTPGVSFVSLQVGSRALDANDYAIGRPELGDYYDTARVLKSLDLVITVDTSVAHLAGALGVLTWILIPLAADWRWMKDRDETPWYDSVTLYRQKTAGDWPEVIERVRSHLEAIVLHRSAA